MPQTWESVCSLEHVRVIAAAAVAAGWMVVSAVIAVVRALQQDDHDPDAGERDGSTPTSTPTSTLTDPFRLARLSLT